MHAMRPFIVLLLSCAAAFGADGGVHIASTAKTNAESASITTKDFYTRDGQTNLVRHTKTKAGVIQIRIHRFYHAGALVGDYVATRDSSGLTTEAGIPYSVSLECAASGSPKFVVIGKEGVILDAFSYTNGVFSPVESAALTKAKAAGSKTQAVMDELSERSKKR